MELLDSLNVYHKGEPRLIEIYQGDLTDLRADEAVDLLVVSAFPGDYTPVKGTLIGALDDQGVSVSQLARQKAFDLRETFSCWLSKEIQSSNSRIQFKRILCFEPLIRGKPSQVVGDIFQSLMPFASGEPGIHTVAMPVVATGNQRVPLTEMLEPLIDAAVHWLELGLPITHLKIVQLSEARAFELKGAFAILKKKYTSPTISAKRNFKHDIFLSYSHTNKEDAQFCVEELQRQYPGIRVFIDRKELNAGSSWQQEIFEALDDCRKVMTLYSPAYLLSKVCKEEFNIALFRHRDSIEGVLMPIYLYSTDLPTYMKILQFHDCREGSRIKLRSACENIALELKLS